MNPVPNLFPTIPDIRRLALIGEAPGKDEEYYGQPFVGQSGRLLSTLLSRAGIARESCFLGNISQTRPSNNDITTITWQGPEIQSGLATLREDLSRFKPNLVLLLGNVPLKAAKDPASPRGWPKKFLFSNAHWRGSLFRCDEAASPFHGFKCMATYHPAFCLRDYACTPFLQLDIRKAVRESSSSDLTLPQRTLVTSPSFVELVRFFYDILERKPKLGIDIEGGVGGISCIGFATSPTYAMIFPIVHRTGLSYWTKEQEVYLWRLAARVLEDASIPKVLQNSLYDRFVLHWTGGVRLIGTADDTMLKHWALYSELAKDAEKKKGRRGMGLAIQASIYTNEPYWKGDDFYEATEDEAFFRGCLLDATVTLEISNTLDEILNSQKPNTFLPVELSSMRTNYRFNMQMLNPLLYMELRGIPYNSALAKQRRADLQHQLYAEQAKLNAITGHGFSWTKKEEIFWQARTLLAKKAGTPSTFDHIADQSYANKRDDAAQLAQLMREPNPDIATMGLVENICGVSLNVDSTKQFNHYIYEVLNLPVQYSDDDDVPKPTSDYEALLKLSRICQQEKRYSAFLPVIQSAITIRALATRQAVLGASADNDGRIRCGYNVVGSNTGRITCYESPTGSGFNLQTVPNYTDKKLAPGGLLGDRDLFLADEGFYFFQCDLAGADGWTVAAYAAMYGDPTMLEDYRAGVRPFERLCLKLMGIPIPRDRHELLAVCRSRIDKNGWPRFACKRVQHGGCYLEGEVTVSRNVLKDSEGQLYFPPKEARSLLDFMKVEMYPGIARWHNGVAGRIRQRPVLQAASGQVRQFFGRPDEIMTKAVAFEPQANTTYATNKAMLRLWTDPDNHIWTENSVAMQRVTTGRHCSLRCEPLHQVHDALCGQFRKEDAEWAVGKIKTWFQNPLLIGGQQIIIPFDGAYGPSWGDMPFKIKC